MNAGITKAVLTDEGNPKQALLPSRAEASERLGKLIRTSRLQRHWTLSALSQKSGVSKSTLSKIENNLLSPSFQIVQQVTEALNLDLPQLFAAHPVDERLCRRAVTRKHEGVIHPTATYQHRLLVNEISQKKMLPFISTIKARSVDEFDGWVRHQGEEFFLVLSGSVEMHTDSYRSIRLDAGDSSYFDSTMGHALISVSKQNAEVLWVVSI